MEYTSTELRAFAEMRLRPNVDVEVVRSLCRVVTQQTEATDEGTLAHHYYLSEDEKTLIAQEHYRDGVSMLEHLKHMDPSVIEQLLASIDLVDSRIYGNDVPDELREIVGRFGTTTFYPGVSGFTR